MEPATHSLNLTKHFHKKPFLYIDDKRQGLIHGYKFIGTLSLLKFGEVIRDARDQHLQQYTSILRRTKYLKYLNSQNFIQIPAYVFSDVKRFSQCLKRADTLEFRNIRTIKHLKNLEMAILRDIFPSEVKMNKKLSHTLLSLQLFAPKANADEILKKIAVLESALSNSFQIKRLTVEADDIIYDFQIKNSKEFQKLVLNFDETCLYLNSTVKIDHTNFPVDFFDGNLKSCLINVPVSGSFLIKELERNKKSLEQLEKLVYSERNSCNRDTELQDDIQSYDSHIPSFIFMNELKNLKTLALSLDCTRFTKNLTEVVNCLVFPESVETLGLQLINCDLNLAFEEFALSSTKLDNDSIIVSCFKSFIERFGALSNLKVFAFEVYHPATDAKVPLLITYEILKRIDQKLDGLLLEYENCLLTQDQLDIQPILSEVVRLEPSKRTISLPFGSNTPSINELTLKQVFCMSGDILFTNFGKYTATQIATIEGESWYFGHSIGRGSLSFSFADFFDVDVTIRYVIEKFTQKDSDAIIMPHSLKYMLQHILHPKMETEIKYAKVSSNKRTDLASNKLDVLIQGETRTANQVLELDLITTLEEGIDT